MKIIIETEKDRVTDLKFEDANNKEATYENLTAILFCVLENLTVQVKESIEDEAEMREFCGYLCGACDQLCIRCFPEDLSEPAFELSDAAILYGEDQIIKRAEKKGITFEEALAQYEEKAKKYVAERSGVLNS